MSRKPPEELTPLGERLDWILEARGWSARHLAIQSGLAPSHITTLKSAKSNPTVATLSKVARAANVSLDWLLTGLEPREPYKPGKWEAMGERILSAPELDKPLDIDPFDALLEAAFEKGRHSLKAVDAVRRLRLSIAITDCLSGESLSEPHISEMKGVLDAATSLLSDGVLVTAESLLRQYTMNSVTEKIARRGQEIFDVIAELEKRPGRVEPGLVERLRSAAAEISEIRTQLRTVDSTIMTERRLAARVRRNINAHPRGPAKPDGSG